MRTALANIALNLLKNFETLYVVKLDVYQELIVPIDCG